MECIFFNKDDVGGWVIGSLNKDNSLGMNCVSKIIPRLLDLLSAEPRWGEGEVCEECQVSFDIGCGKGDFLIG